MDHQLTVVLLLVCASFVVCIASVSASDTKLKECNFPTEYHNRERDVCASCTVCDNHQITLRQCYGDKDTLCGTFSKFQFRQSLDQDNFPSEAISENNHHHQQQQTHLSTTMVFADDSLDEKWFSITMVLISVLVVSCILLFFITCYVCKKKQREIVCDPVFTSALLKIDSPPVTPPKMEQFKIITET